MALSKSVEDSLKEAESNLRNALAFVKPDKNVPWFCGVIAEMITKIDTLQTMDSIMDKVENRNPGDSGLFGNFFVDDDE